VGGGEAQLVDREARKARHGYQALELIGLALALAVAVAVATPLGAGAKVPIVLGALIALVTGLRQVFGSKDNWVAFITAQLAIDHGLALYDNKVDAYAHDGDAMLIKRVNRSSPTRPAAG